MNQYLDASAIVPTVINESASQVMAQFVLATTATMVVSDFAAAEVTSAASRLVRMMVLTMGDAVARLRQFDAWRAIATEEIDFRPSDFRLADVFARRFDPGLRAPDAVHAAVRRRADLQVITLDRKLASAAEALGVRVEMPAAG